MNTVHQPHTPSPDHTVSSDLIHAVRDLGTGDIYRMVAHCLNELEGRQEKILFSGGDKGYMLRGHSYRITWDASISAWLGFPEVSLPTESERI